MSYKILLKTCDNEVVSSVILNLNKDYDDETIKTLAKITFDRKGFDCKKENIIIEKIHK